MEKKNKKRSKEELDDDESDDDDDDDCYENDIQQVLQSQCMNYHDN